MAPTQDPGRFYERASGLEIGIFAKTFIRPTLGASLGAARETGFRNVHFDFAMLGRGVLPADLTEATAQGVAHEMRRHALDMSSVEGTYNMAHRSESVRKEGRSRLARLIECTPTLGAELVTLCTGSRDEGMWRFHPDNGSLEAWRDMRESVAAAVEVAERQGVTLCIECEYNNVVSSARGARRLLDEIGSPSLRIVLDAANLVPPDSLDEQDYLLKEAFDLLGPDIVLAHAKDRGRDGTIVAAGSGGINFPLYLDLLANVGFSGVLVLHGLSESDVPDAKAFVTAASRAAYEKVEDYGAITNTSLGEQR